MPSRRHAPSGAVREISLPRDYSPLSKVAIDVKKMPGWKVLLRRGKMRAGVPLLDLSTIGLHFRTPTDALAPVQGDVFEAALLNRDQSVEIPIRARAVRRKVSSSGAVAVAARFRGIGLNSIVRIATLIRVHNRMEADWPEDPADVDEDADWDDLAA